MDKEKRYEGMYNPPHPGEIILEVCIKPLGLTITDAAKALKVSRKSLSELINGKYGVSPEMAVKLSKAFGSTPEHWLGLQTQYDLWNLRDYDVSDIKPLHEMTVNG